MKVLVSWVMEVVAGAAVLAVALFMVAVVLGLILTMYVGIAGEREWLVGVLDGWGW